MTELVLKSIWLDENFPNSLKFFQLVFVCRSCHFELCIFETPYLEQKPLYSNRYISLLLCSVCQQHERGDKYYFHENNCPLKIGLFFSVQWEVNKYKYNCVGLLLSSRNNFAIISLHYEIQNHVFLSCSRLESDKSINNVSN